MSLHQPLAVIGIGVCFPFAASFTELTTRLKSPDEIEVSLMKWGNHPHTIAGHQFSELAFDYKKFGIPPIFRQAVSTETLLALMAVDDALMDLDPSSWDLDRTDCFCGTSFGNDAIYRNAVKVAAVKAKAESLASSGDVARERQEQQEQQEQIVDQFKSVVSKQFSATSHDRVGEMASSVPARIAHYLGSRGKCMTLDSLDLSGDPVIYKRLMTASVMPIVP
ncbi:beta-ketoacyl synthase N-terminal-like domain-containing protein [Vibrio sp. PP-XX7]